MASFALRQAGSYLIAVSAVLLLTQCLGREMLDVGSLSTPAPPVFPKSFEVRDQFLNPSWSICLLDCLLITNCSAITSNTIYDKR